MSAVEMIKTAIARIKTAKEKLRTWLTNAGVTVPDGTKLDGMAALIEGIEAGGGTQKIFGSSNFEAGTFTGNEGSSISIPKPDWAPASAGQINFLCYTPDPSPGGAPLVNVVLKINRNPNVLKNILINDGKDFDNYSSLRIYYSSGSIIISAGTYYTVYGATYYYLLWLDEVTE